MKIRAWFGGVAAAALVTGLAMLARTDEGSLTIQVQAVPPPSCSFQCDSHDPRGLPRNYCNGREAYLSGLPPGHIRVTWNCQNATSITLEGRTVGASGTEVHYMSQPSWREFRLIASGQAEPRFDASVYGRTSCFLAGTKILLADGTHKNIEDFEGGEDVMAYDPATGQMVTSKVTEKITSGTTRWYLVNDNLKVSVGHQIYANGQWTWSENLKVGDKLFDAGGNEVPITEIKTFDEQVDVYNLITEPAHNFFAGSIQQTFLVHNENKLPGHANKGLVKGMEVILASGKKVKVENLKPGDKLLSYDFKAKKYLMSTVKDTAAQKAKGFVEINGKFKLAKGHELYIAPKAEKKEKKKK
jgi:hypothetical protein